MNLLACRGLELELGGRRLIDGLDFELKSGELCAVLGANGSGKSALLKTLLGLLPRQKGEVMINGRALEAIPRRQLAREVGMLFQEQHDPFPATVEEALLAGLHPHLGPWQRESREQHQQAERLLTELDLAPLRQHHLGTLSGGERQRLSIATLLLQDCPLMLLDEPTNHLDLPHQITILRRLRQMADAGYGLLMVVHDPNLAVRFCDRALLLYGDGRTTSGSVEEMLESERLGELYGHPLTRLDGPHGPLFIPE